MRSSEDTAALQLEALSNFLAFTSRDPSVPLSEQNTRDAAAGDVWARRVMQSRILECPQSVETVAPVDDLAARRCRRSLWQLSRQMRGSRSELWRRASWSACTRGVGAEVWVRRRDD